MTIKLTIVSSPESSLAKVILSGIHYLFIDGNDIIFRKRNGVTTTFKRVQVIKIEGTRV